MTSSPKKAPPKITCNCGRSFTEQGFARHKCEKKQELAKCDFCKEVFTTEKRLLSHFCEQKRRFMQKDDKTTKMGFMAFEEFYRKSMGKVPTYESFMKSTLYGAFVRFGKHLVDLNALNPLGYVDYLIKIEAPVDKWLSPTYYSAYVRELNKNESAIDALERNFLLMEQWSIETGEAWQDFFRKVAPPLATMWITNGRISPWVLFTASSAHDLLARLSPEQSAMVQKNIDPEFWRLKIQRHKDEVEEIRTVLMEHGI